MHPDRNCGYWGSRLSALEPLATTCPRLLGVSGVGSALRPPALRERRDAAPSRTDPHERGNPDNSDPKITNDC